MRITFMRFDVVVFSVFGIGVEKCLGMWGWGELLWGRMRGF